MSQDGQVAVRGGAARPASLAAGEDFPLLCETCLGDSRFVRMLKEAAWNACRVTGRPFQPFKWRPGRNVPLRETIVCYEFAAEKNVCQCCLNDLDYAIPMALRDSFAAAQRGEDEAATAPKSEVNQTFSFNQRLLERAAGLDKAAAAPAYRLLADAGAAAAATEAASLKLPALCFAWLKGGACARPGCAFRPCCGAFSFPEAAGDAACAAAAASLVAQLRAAPRGARGVAGVSDRVLQRARLDAARRQQAEARDKALEPPADRSVTTLYLAGLPARADEAQVRLALATFGKLDRVHMAADKSFAFAQFHERGAAEECIREHKGSLEVAGVKVRMAWAAKRKSQGEGEGEGEGEGSTREHQGERQHKLEHEHEHVPAAAPKDYEGDDAAKSQREVREREAARHESEQKAQASAVPRATPIPELAPGVLLPYGLFPGDELPDAPAPLAALLGGLRSGAKRKGASSEGPPAKRQTQAADPRLFYPALGPGALEGNIPSF